MVVVILKRKECHAVGTMTCNQHPISDLRSVWGKKAPLCHPPFFTHTPLSPPLHNWILAPPTWVWKIHRWDFFEAATVAAPTIGQLQPCSHAVRQICFPSLHFQFFTPAVRSFFVKRGFPKCYYVLSLGWWDVFFSPEICFRRWKNCNSLFIYQIFCKRIGSQIFSCFFPGRLTI